MEGLITKENQKNALLTSGKNIHCRISNTLSYLKQLLNFNNADELQSIQPGEGKIVKMLEEQFGVYRDQNGSLHMVSSKCTHLKCTLTWNADELSWDCPYHGSRFTYEGKVISGPANHNLPVYRFDVKEKEFVKQK